MTKKPSESVSVLNKTSRRQFVRKSSGLLLAGAATALSPAALAADCDQGGERSESSDQDAGQGSDRKDCHPPKNIISQTLPERKRAVTVKTIKA